MTILNKVLINSLDNIKGMGDFPHLFIVRKDDDIMVITENKNSTMYINMVYDTFTVQEMDDMGFEVIVLTNLKVINRIVDSTSIIHINKVCELASGKVAVVDYTITTGRATNNLVGVNPDRATIKNPKILNNTSDYTVSFKISKTLINELNMVAANTPTNIIGEKMISFDQHDDHMFITFNEGDKEFGKVCVDIEHYGNKVSSSPIVSFNSFISVLKKSLDNDSVFSISFNDHTLFIESETPDYLTITALPSMK